MSERVSFGEIRRLLNERPELVTDRYCASHGAWRDRQGRLFCLSPLRADRHVGSFYVNLEGVYAGHWRDESTGDHGDMLDFIRGVEGCDQITATRIAKSFLGIEGADPALWARMARSAEERTHRCEAEAARLGEQEARASLAARRLWDSGEPRILYTPAGLYLEARGIRLRRSGRQPRALRFHPACSLHCHDPKTGEVIEGQFPAMLAAISAVDGTFMAGHRTYLARGRGGVWGELACANPKKVLGPKQGGCIRIWSGAGPRGGAGCPLNQAPPGTRVYVTEGIEDALSVAMLKPDARVLAAIDLANMAHLRLPDAVTEVVLCADNRPASEALALFDWAVEAHQRAGRIVRVFRNVWGGKGVNDALRMVGGEEAGDDGA